MRSGPLVSGRSVRLDLENQQAWHGDRLLALSPKAFSVLRCLMERGGRLVTKQELLDAVWPDVTVSEGVLTTCVREIRKELHERAREPRYIETVHGRGYRFLEPAAKAARTDVAARIAPTLVGRRDELQRLGAWLERAVAGERQVLFVTGEAGIGKTALVDAFIETEGGRVATIGRGQCLERYGADEPYFPVLELLGRLGQDARGDHLVQLLRRHAPSWLAQLPSLVAPEDLEALQRRSAGVTSGRMLRELAEALEASAKDEPLVLVLEDLHWSDHATVSLVSFLAQRRAPARLMLIGTYRPVDVIVRDHPLKEVKQSLRMHRQCEELALDGLSEGEVGEYLAQRFSVEEPLALRPVAQVIHRRTEGNPLFMVNLGDVLVAREVVVRREDRWEVVGALEEFAGAVPDTLREMIEQQLERCDAGEQRVLEAASVVGAGFSGAAVAAALELEVQTAEGLCQRLARRGQFLQACGQEDWPDGTVTTRYRFLHAAYSEVLYGRLNAPTRVALHRRIGERLEAAYRGHTAQIAAELALHFEEGREPAKALDWSSQAGERALGLLAYEEAMRHFERAIEALASLAPDDERRFELLLRLGEAAWGAVEIRKAKQTMRRAFDLVPGDPSRLARAALGYAGSYTGLVAAGSDEVAVDLLERALGAIGEEPSVLRARLMSRLAAMLTFSRDGRRRASLARGAIELARTIGDKTVLGHVLQSSHFALSGPDAGDETMALADEIIRIGEATDDPLRAAIGHAARLAHLLERGDFPAAEREIALHARFTESTDQRKWLAAGHATMRALLEGRFEDAENLAGRALELSKNPTAVPFIGIQMTFLRREQGRLAEFLEPLNALVARYPTLANWRSARAWVNSELGHLDEARDELDALSADDFGALPRSVMWISAVWGLAETAAAVGDKRQALRLYELLGPHRDRCMVIPDAICAGSIARSLGLLATTLERFEEAEGHFERALAMNAKLGSRPWVAHTQHEYGRMLLARGEREKALRLIGEAAGTARALGMTSLREKAEASLQSSGRPQRRHNRLTPSSRRVR